MTDQLTLAPLVGLAFGPGSVTEWDPAVAGDARIGRPVWGRAALLRDLEMRLGLAVADVPAAVRLQQWQRRLAEYADSGAVFYARSFQHDPIGTAAAVLQMRDELMDAGWNGETVADGGARLATFASLDSAELPHGDADRLRLVEAALAEEESAPYAELALAEAPAAWTGRWRRIFERLEALGARVHVPGVDSGEGTAPDSDLGRLQAMMRGDGASSKARVKLVGDGSLVLLRAETGGELADAVAALIANLEACPSENDERLIRSNQKRKSKSSSPSADARTASLGTVVIRNGEARSLELALEAHGLATHGVSDTSSWRPALQVLPLTLELLFAPKDPCRVLELVTLPNGPLSGLVGRELARALVEAPGIGGPAWQTAKAEISSRTHERALAKAEAAGEKDPMATAKEAVARHLARVEQWLEAPCHDVVEGVPRALLLEQVARVRDWLRTQMILAREAEASAASSQVAGAAETSDEAGRSATLGTAFARADDLHAALSHDPRERFDRFGLWHLVDRVSGSGHSLSLRTGRAGRVDFVSTPSGLRRACKSVVWWHAVAGAEWRPAARPWRQAELRALLQAGIHFADDAARLGAEHRSWRNAVLSARERLVLATPHTARGQRLEAHPIWDEIVARLRVDEAQLSSVIVNASEILQQNGDLTQVKLGVSRLEPLRLPGARVEWQVPAELLRIGDSVSATQLEALVECPLKWALRYRARLRSGTVARLADGPLLYGKLTHRLVELVAKDGALADPARVVQVMDQHFDRLVEEEAALLLRAGQSFDLIETRRAISQSLTKLARLLEASQLDVTAVEANSSAEWLGRSLTGRLDVLLEDEQRQEIVLDLKWGRSSYESKLRAGLAIQLAVYAAARQLETGAKMFPVAAYYALGRGELLTTEAGPFTDVYPKMGPPIAETWKRLEATVAAVETLLGAGRLPVTGVLTTSKRPLLDAIGVAADDRQHLPLLREVGCKYCEFPGLCGKQWELQR